ncbi:endoribonuclease YbeY-like [Saccoglossus kowalevskii]|uniref:Ribonuclease-like n=1 Tax=Saccoglossus kowalevskii TaxID=10224 RepID=A0ABM0LVU4_SACKO|nr:PREDICTED: putative ribonuclease-like [Saccoglossus kowalevskii]
MSLIVKNLQRVVSFNIGRLERDLGIIRQLMGVETYDVAVLCVDDRKIQELNRNYRGQGVPTDVLSFPAYEIASPGLLPDISEDEVPDLGDMFLGLPYIQHQCQQDGGNLSEVLPVIATHGLCHLIGYDHKTENQWKQMFDKELSIFQEYNKLTGLNLKPLLDKME